MKYTIRDIGLELIDEPLQSHVIAWERASRAMKTEDAKELLNDMASSFQGVKVDNAPEIIAVFVNAFKSLNKAIEIIGHNETLTLSANRGVFVKAALQAGWVVSITQGDTAILQTVEDVDTAKPWLVSWIAEHVANLYLEVTTIPKN